MTAQAIADRMAPIVAREGFAKEWALFGPALVMEHIDKNVAKAAERLEAECAAAMKGGSFVTLRCDVASGKSAFTEAPGQGEHRIILDGSCERDRLAGFRGFCRLLGCREQRVLALASEVLIIASPIPE
jgi:hypothetical protein